MNRRRKFTIGVIVVAVTLSSLVVFVIIPSVQRQNSCRQDSTSFNPVTCGKETVHLQIEIIYSASWNGSYSYASGSLNHLVPLSGTGQKNVSITFVGNIFSGIHYQVAFQKNDSSSGTLTVSVTSDVLGSQTHSNSSAFGIVEFGQGVIS